LATNEPNPYAAPQVEIPPAWAANPEQKKIEAVIKDANQFWLAIVLCIFCSGIGAILIGPWYFFRLLQWGSIARAQPALLDPNVPRGSLEQRFQSARWKLIVGICVGAFMFLLTCLYFASIAVVVRNGP
jgi:hypothetical protein